MLQRQQFNVFRLKLLPLFLLILFVLIIIPSNPIIHATGPPVFVNQVTKFGCGGTSCVLNSLSTGANEIIVIADYQFNVAGTYTVTDTSGNSYSQLYNLLSNGNEREIMFFTTASGGSDVITLNYPAGVVVEADALQYSNFVSFGQRASTTTAPGSGSGSDTQTINIGSVSIVLETGLILNSISNTCGTQTMTGTSRATNCDTSFGTVGMGLSQFEHSNQSPGNNGYTNTYAGWNTPGGFIHVVQELQGSGNPTPGGTLTTQCYGNCGNPPITIVNTNSTHTINFNQSITLFYEFQTNLNGLINNVTLNYAAICGSGNKCTVNTLFIAAYSAGSCGANTQPFTSSCPGSRLSQFSTTPTKARLSMQCPSNCVVVAGQWIGIAVSASFSGIDINDTNTNVSLFQANGIIPTTISASSSAGSLCAGCKMGLWAWITGNVVTGTTPPNIGTNCGNGIGDYLTCLTQTFCTGTPNAGCTLAGGLFWSMIYSVVGVVGLMWIDHKFLGNDENSSGVHVPATGYAFIPLGVQFMFIALGVLPLWWGILLIMTLTIMFTSILLGIVKSGNK